MLQCTSAYPCPPENIGLNLLPFFRDRYGCSVGLSDHSGTIYAGLAAVTLGATMLEVHVTFSREMFGPDVPASITLEELRQLVDGIRFIEAMTAHPVDKDAMAETMVPLRHLFTKSGGTYRFARRHGAASGAFDGEKAGHGHSRSTSERTAGAHLALPSRPRPMSGRGTPGAAYLHRVRPDYRRGALAVRLLNMFR